MSKPNKLKWRLETPVTRSNSTAQVSLSYSFRMSSSL